MIFISLSVAVALLSSKAVHGSCVTRCDEALLDRGLVLERILSGCDELWPDVGGLTFEITEQTAITTLRREPGTKVPKSVSQVLTKDITFSICGDFAHINAEQFRADGGIISRTEMLDQIDGRLEWGWSPSTGEYLTKILPLAARGELTTHRMVPFVAGTIESEHVPRLKDFLRRHQKALRIEVAENGVARVLLAESGNATWRFEFTGDPNTPLFLKSLVHVQTAPGNTYKSHTMEIADIEYRLNNTGRKYADRFVIRTSDEYSGLVVLQRTVESRYDVTQFTYETDKNHRSMKLIHQPMDGMNVDVEGSEWLHHEWRDGKVVQVTDPVAMERLEAFAFRNEGIAWRKWLLGSVSLGLAIVTAWLYWRKSRTAVILLAVLGTCGQAIGQESHATAVAAISSGNPVTSTESLMAWDEPYCGIVSAFAVVKHFRKPAKFQDLINVDYVGSWEGSSGLQIQAALKKYGIESTAFTRTTPSTLLVCNGPVILHTRSRSSPLYRHWVTYFGRDGNALKILDPSLGMIRMTPSELQAQWDGLMIAPIDSSPNRIIFLAATFLDYFYACGFGVVLCASMAAWSRKAAAKMASPHFGQRVLQQSLLLLTCGMGFGFCFGWYVPGGLNQSEAALATIAGLHPAEFLASANIEDVNSIIAGSRPDTVLIDCRFASTFNRGSIPGAVNIPVDATAAVESKQLEGIDKDQTLVLFCQSENCSYDELVARRMIARGFRSVQLFHGGFAAWKQLSNPPQNPVPHETTP